jgi:ubiquinone/menaquinone biosynthesis C-methylase UbiE
MKLNNLFDINIPSIDKYSLLVESNYFKKFLSFSDDFLKRNSSHLYSYFGKWGKDPLNQWSRKWEYPFTFYQITKAFDSTGNTSEIDINDETLNSNADKSKDTSNFKILDAGSGITFFPYFLQNNFSNAQVIAFDYDNSYTPIFKEINIQETSVVEFVQGNLEHLPFDDKSFDIVYCISTLEHTTNLEKIISEFHRVLKPEGKLILTIDIAELEIIDIPIDKGNFLHSRILNIFDSLISNKNNPIPHNIFSQNILTSKYTYKLNPELIWKHTLYMKIKYFLSYLIKRRSIRFFPDNLTVFCEVYTKK